MWNRFRAFTLRYAKYIRIFSDSHFVQQAVYLNMLIIYVVQISISKTAKLNGFVKNRHSFSLSNPLFQSMQLQQESHEMAITMHKKLTDVTHFKIEKKESTKIFRKCASKKNWAAKKMTKNPQQKLFHNCVTK